MLVNSGVFLYLKTRVMNMIYNLRESFYIYLTKFSRETIPEVDMHQPPDSVCIIKQFKI